MLPAACQFDFILYLRQLYNINTHEFPVRGHIYMYILFNTDSKLAFGCLSSVILSRSMYYSMYYYLVYITLYIYILYYILYYIAFVTNKMDLTQQTHVTHVSSHVNDNKEYSYIHRLMCTVYKKKKSRFMDTVLL